MKRNSYAGLIKEFFSPLSLSKKIVFILLDAFLSFYIAATQFLAYSRVFLSRWDTIYSIISFCVYFVLIFNLLIYAIYAFRNKGIYVNAQKERLSVKTFFIYFLICFGVLAVMLTAYYPGGISSDNLVQWEQVQKFKFDDWHPVAHTLMIWLITRIYNSYPFVILFQCLAFGIGAGYMIATLEAWGIKKGILAAIGFGIILNPATRKIMMYAWKDTALTILILYLLTQTINIYFSDGQWLKKYRNLAVFSVCLTLAAVVRHNGFFYTMPLLGFVFFLYFRKISNVRVLLVLSILLLYGIKGPLYRALNVTYPDQTYAESIGLPMTIMGDVMVKNPGALTPQTKSFLNKLASDEMWKKSYVPGNFNSIKFKLFRANVFLADKLKDVPVRTFINMTLDTIGRDKRNSFMAVVGLTDLVWKTKGEPEGRYEVYCQGGSIGYTFNNTPYNRYAGKISGMLDNFSNIPFLNWILMMTGPQMLLMMLVGLFACYTRGIGSLMFVFPQVIYNIGTMLLLCGEDYRFFHFNAVTFIPVCVVLLCKKQARSIMGKKMIKLD